MKVTVLGANGAFSVGKHIDENEFKGVLKMGDVQEY